MSWRPWAVIQVMNEWWTGGQHRCLLVSWFWTVAQTPVLPGKSDAVNGWISRVIKLIYVDKTAFTKPHAKVWFTVFDAFRHFLFELVSWTPKPNPPGRQTLERPQEFLTMEKAQAARKSLNWTEATEVTDHWQLRMHEALGHWVHSDGEDEQYDN